ncbi:MAG: RidA family protein [Thermodesulfovibrio sp.]|nr:RidA family protein [Thermodesulfovibrio sp.]
MIDEKIKQLGINIPEAVKPVGVYVPALRVGNLLFLSGILPFREGKILRKGKVGKQVSLQEAGEEAIQTVLNALAVVKDYVGSLDKIKRCIKITGYVASSEEFIEQPKVLNPASELMVKIFGDRGKHCRVAVGVCSLPLDAVVEMDFIFEVD